MKFRSRTREHIQEYKYGRYVLPVSSLSLSLMFAYLGTVTTTFQGVYSKGYSRLIRYLTQHSSSNPTLFSTTSGSFVL